MGRPRSCSCGTCAKCKDRERKAAQYAAMTPAQRRAWKRRKSKVSQYVANRTARKRHSTRYPEKVAAREAMHRALKSGILKRLPCAVCGITHGTIREDGTKVRVEGHHADYSKPLDVTFYCGDHHRPPWVSDRG